MTTAFLREVIDTAGALGMPAWQRFALVLALSLVRVLGRRGITVALAALARIEIEEQLDPERPESVVSNVPTGPLPPGETGREGG